MAQFPITSTTGDPVFRSQNNSVNAIKRFTRVAADSSVKLNNQERIVSPGDDPLSFSTSRRIRADIKSLRIVSETGQLNVTGLNLALSGLDSIKTQLAKVKQKVVQSQVADTKERDGIQSEIDLALAQIDSTARNTKLGNRRLLDGTATPTGVFSIEDDGTTIDFSIRQSGGSVGSVAGILNVRVNKIGVGGVTRSLDDGRQVLSLGASIISSNKASRAFLGFTTNAAGEFAEFRITGKLGSATIRIDSSAADLTVNKLTSVAQAFNAQAPQTGVVFTSSTGGTVGLTTVGYGDDEFIKVELIASSGTASTAAFGAVAGTDSLGTTATDFGKSATVTIAGTEVNLGGEFGTTARYLANGFDIEIDFGTRTLTSDTTTISSRVVVDISKGARGLLGASGSTGDIVHYGFGNFTTEALGRGAPINTVTRASSGIPFGTGAVNTSLGNQVLGGESLADLGSGGRLDLSSGAFFKALTTIDRAIGQIIDAETRLGSIQGNFIDAINRAEVGVGNLTSADADIIGVDAATEITNLIQAQLGISTASSVLSQANAIQANIFSLLRG